MTEKEFLKAMGAKIKYVRKSKKISGIVMAKLTPMSKSSLYRLESGRKNCHILTLYKIANALDVDVKTFF